MPRPDHGPKVSNALRGRRHSSERRVAIAIARTRDLTDDEKAIVADRIATTLIVDVPLLTKLCGLSNPRAVYRFLESEEGSDLAMQRARRLHVPTAVQKWTAETLSNFRRDATLTDGRSLAKAYNLSNKVCSSLLKKLGIRRIPKWSGGRRGGSGGTSIERFVHSVLVESGAEFEREFRFKKWFFDFKVGNVLIEANGDFWHCNPRVYKKPISRLQSANMANDHRKRITVEAETDYRVVYIWERDILTSPSEVKEKILALCKQHP